MREGVYAATQAVKDAAGVERMNAVGYCIGGTLLSATLAHMAKTGDTSIQSATFFAAQADFKLAGDLLVFSDDQAIKFLEDKMDQAGGVLDAQTMADTFNSLRSNDLIWNYVVDNYYIGKQPPPFDLLYWNADQTRMPKALHLFYLRNFYRDNALTEGKLELMGEKLLAEGRDRSRSSCKARRKITSRLRRASIAPRSRSADRSNTSSRALATSPA